MTSSGKKGNVTSRHELWWELNWNFFTLECLRKRKYPGYIIRDLGNYISEIRQFEAEI